jgi:hypothetical protein
MSISQKLISRHHVILENIEDKHDLFFKKLQKYFLMSQESSSEEN